MSDQTHVTGSAGAETLTVTNDHADRLRSLVDRIERLIAERKALAEDIKDIYAEAKSAGFDVAALKRLIQIRAKDPAEVDEIETMVVIYRNALGM